MADTSLDLLNQTQVELLQKYDDAANKLIEVKEHLACGKVKVAEAENASKLGGKTLEEVLASDKVAKDAQKLNGKTLDEILATERIAEAENALKLGGKKLLATVNSDGSFNDDGIFKIKEVGGKKTLLGVLDADIEFTSAPPAANSFDIFGDGSRIALFEFEGNANDTGGVYNGTPTDITYDTGKFGQAVKSSTSSQVKISNLPFNSNTKVVTISAWVKWNGNDGVMPFGWNIYDIYFSNGNFGINTGNSDIYGVSSSGFKNTWKHLVVEFRKGEYGKIWVDGELQILSQRRGSIITSYAVMGSEFHVFGWGYGTGYRNFGLIDHVSIFNRALTDAEVKKLYNEGA